MLPLYRDHRTERFAHGEQVPAFQAIERPAERRLQFLLNAASLADIGAISGYRLEPLKGHRTGQWSIRINDQWRICLKWDGATKSPSNIEIVDYH